MHHESWSQSLNSIAQTIAEHIIWCAHGMLALQLACPLVLAWGRGHHEQLPKHRHKHLRRARLCMNTGHYASCFHKTCTCGTRGCTTRLEIKDGHCFFMPLDRYLEVFIAPHTTGSVLSLNQIIVAKVSTSCALNPSLLTRKFVCLWNPSFESVFAQTKHIMLRVWVRFHGVCFPWRIVW